MASTIRVALGVDGAAEFQAQMKKSDAAIKALGSELKLTTAEFGTAANSEKGLIAQNDVLQRSVQTLKEKLAEQEKALDAVGKEFGEDSAETLKFVDAVNQTKLKIAEAENKIRANEEAMNGLGNETQKAAKETTTFGEVLKANLASEAIVAGVKALANAIADVAKKMVEVVTASAEWADELNTLSMQTGLSTEQLQKYQYASDLIDVSVETITGSMTKLTKNMSSAKGGTGAAAEAFATLGISITDSTGALRDNEDVFNDVIDALGSVGNETERDALAMSIFGKSAQELNPLIIQGSEAMKKLGDEAEAAGLILDDDALNGLNSVNDAIGTLKATAQGAGRQLTASFAQPMATALNQVKGYLQQIVSSFTEGGFSALGDTLGGIIRDAAATLNEYLPEILNFGMNLIATLVTGMTEMLPDLANTAIVIIENLVTSLTENLPTLIPVAINAVMTIVDTLIEHAGDLVDGAIQLINALAIGLVTDGLPILLQKAPELVSSLVTAIVQNAPKLITSAIELVGQLVAGIIKSLPELGKSALSIVESIVQGIVSLWQKLNEVGTNIVKGIVNGITSAFTWAWEQVKNFFSSIIDGVKSFLGIASPSKVFAGIGENMALGIGEGFEDTMKAVGKDINSSLDQPYAGSISISGGQTSTVINLTTTLDGEVLARNQYKYNQREAARRGPSLVGGMA